MLHLTIWNWVQEVHQDNKLQDIIQALFPESHKGYKLQGDKLCYEGKLVPPHSYIHIPTILEECHDSPIGGHLGFFRTFKRVVAVVYREGMGLK